METANALRVGDHAFSYLTAAPRLGHVVSTFRHGLNVLFCEETDPTLISIQTGDVPLHPWALEVTELSARSKTGTTVSADSEAIRLAASSILWGQATRHALRISGYTGDDLQRTLARFSLLEASALEGMPLPHDPFQSRIDGLLAGWRATHEARVLPALIGLGSGSTPSGDDVLVGILAGWTALRGVDDFAHRSLTILRPIVAEMDLGKRTHGPSAQMIDAALDGSFPEPLCDLVAALGSTSDRNSEIQRTARKLLGLGDNSGRMMLRGLMLVAMPSIDRNL